MLRHKTHCRPFQSTPARGGRRDVANRLRGRASVSIHARAGRATAPGSNRCRDRRVSIHARAGRATVDLVIGVRIHLRFNPRPRGAGDGGRLRRPRRRRCFNPRPRGAGDTAAVRQTVPPGTFQSTPARGGRPGGRSGPDGPGGFQSTPARGGRRVTLACVTDALIVSIHARAGRATCLLMGLRRVPLAVSIHARAGRATELLDQGFSELIVSIHARAGRATPPPTHSVCH